MGRLQGASRLLVLEGSVRVEHSRWLQRSLAYVYKCCIEDVFSAGLSEGLAQLL